MTDSNYYVAEIPFASPAYDCCIALRQKILRDPLGMRFKVFDLAQEWNQTHLALFTQCDFIIGCLTFEKYDETSLKMRQVAIDTNYQGKGLGTYLVKAAETWAGRKWYERIVLHARKEAIRFYTSLKYSVVGDEFMEIGIPHRKMLKDIR